MGEQLKIAYLFVTPETLVVVPAREFLNQKGYTTFTRIIGQDVTLEDVLDDSGESRINGILIKIGKRWINGLFQLKASMELGDGDYVNT